MAVATIVALLALYKSSRAAPVPETASNRTCAEFMLPVQVSVIQSVYDYPHVNSSIDVTQFAVDADTWSTLPSPYHVVRNQTIEDTFDISAQLCVPPQGRKHNFLQIATHGLIYDKRYWDVAVNPSEYSYVEAVLEAGYSILTYDRLGTGRSDKPDAYEIVQAPLQEQILRKITEMARSEDLLTQARECNNALPEVSFDKVIHVGHSYGSFLTSALLADYGDLSDAAVITGYIPNSHLTDTTVTSFGYELASENDPATFGDRPSGYIVPGTASAVQTIFFWDKPSESGDVGGFEPALLRYGNSIKQPVTIGELITVSTLNLGVAPEFKGPLQYMEPEHDFAICGGDCKNTYSLDTLKLLYPQATDVNVYLQPDTGHGLTFHRNARSGYQVTLDWLDKNGL